MSDPTTLSKGGNTGISAASVLVTITWQARPDAPDLDLSGLLLGPDGKVHGDGGFIFYNQPTHSSGAVVHRGKSAGSESISADLATLPTEIEKIAIAASADGGTFDQISDLRLTVSDVATGQDLVSFAGIGASTETAVVVGELYRRDGAWRFRAVGQGWETGLAGLATDFGISIAQPAHTTATSGTASADAHDPATDNVPVNLDKGQVSLVKGQKVSLTKSTGPALNDITLGLGWDPASGARDIDLDASVITYDAAGHPLELVFFGHQKAYGAIFHSGDNLTGAGEGDDEQIRVRLAAVPTKVHTLVFTITSYNGQQFTQVDRAFCRLLDDNGTEMVRYDLSDSEPKTGVVMASLQRSAGAWEMKAIGRYADGKTARKLLEAARPVH
ncbi:MAG: TerD family protein [Nocardioides sp.]|uniref:TerD family protein n=1 Tax=Nocardioides sp. TaxID=35761 RepID=UPI003D6A3EF2